MIYFTVSKFVRSMIMRLRLILVMKISRYKLMSLSHYIYNQTEYLLNRTAIELPILGLRPRGRGGHPI